MNIPPQRMIYKHNQNRTKERDLNYGQELPMLTNNELGEAASDELQTRIPVIEVFSALTGAINVGLEILKQGLSPHQISIIAKNKHDLIDSTNHESISLSGNFLAEVLIELGISECGTIRFVNAVDEGKFLLVVIGNDWEAMKAQHVINNIGNWQFINHFKSILTLPA